MDNKARIQIPDWLEESSEQSFEPPVQTRPQVLPFKELTWENFERLCLRLVRKNAEVEYCQLYGERGNDQEGIDIYARLKDTQEYRVYQCKREKEFGPAKIEAAIAKFLKGEWADQVNTFVLCTQESLKLKQRADAFKAQSEKLSENKISLIAWDSDYLNEELKKNADIVQDFFGNSWARMFCGNLEENHSHATSEVLLLVDEYKGWLSSKTSHFTIPSISKQFCIENDWFPRKVFCVQGDQQSFDVHLISELYSHCLLVGDSASGKSTIIRRLANHLTASGNTVLLVRLPEVLRHYKQGSTFNDAILNCSTDGFRSSNKLLRLELDNANYLLADGLDECRANQGDIAEKLKSWVKGHSNTKVIVTSRSSYPLELFCDWEKLEIEPLIENDIQNFSFKIISASLNSQPEVDRNLALIEEIFQNRKTLSMAASSPLLAGFIIHLVISNVHVNDKSRTELYKTVIDLAYRHLPESRDFVDLDKQSARQVLEITGWKLIRNPSISVEKLVDELIKELQARGYTIQDSENKARDGVQFWEDKRILCRSAYVWEDKIEFIHLSLCEYAAAQYVSNLEKSAFQTWLQEVREDDLWKETVCFAAGLGGGSLIIDYIIGLDSQIEKFLNDLILAIKAASEDRNVSSELIEIIVEKAQSYLKSSHPEDVFEVCEALLDILPKESNLIFNRIEPLLKSDKFWIRLAATRLALACDVTTLNLDSLSWLIQQISSNLVIPDLPFLTGGKRCKKHEWKIRNETFISSCKYILNVRGSIEDFNMVWQLVSNGNLSCTTVMSMEYFLKAKVSEKLKTTSSQIEEFEDWVALRSKLICSERYFEKINFSAQCISRELKKLERDRNADLAFLESIVRVTEANKVVNETRGFEQIVLVNLGVLLSGMNWWEMPTTAWDILGDRNDLEVVDVVLTGMIFALDINPNKLRTEALKVLKDLERFFSFNLELVKTVLEAGSGSQKYIQVLNYLFGEIYQDKNASLGLFYQIPKVPAKFKWNLVQDTQLSLEKLVQALDHPSKGISLNAALLIEHVYGGEHTAKLAKRAM